MSESISERLEYLRGEIEAERISYSEIEELQNLGEKGLIPDDDVLLLEWAGVSEHEEGGDIVSKTTNGYQWDQTEDQFWLLDCEPMHFTDLQSSIDKTGLTALVDEAAGGIIAYILPGNEESLMAHLGVKKGVAS